MDAGLLGALKDRLAWLGARQTVLSRNVANANTPGFKPEDLVPFSPRPLKPAGEGSNELAAAPQAYQTKVISGPVSLEDEMSKLGEVQLDYQLASTLYVKSLGLLKIAIGRK